MRRRGRRRASPTAPARRRPHARGSSPAARRPPGTPGSGPGPGFAIVGGPHPGHIRSSASRSDHTGAWSPCGAAPTPRRPARPRRTRRLPRRPSPTRAAQPITLQNARRSPHPRFQLSDSRNRRRGTACGASGPLRRPRKGHKSLFCKAHQTRWRMQGRPDVEQFITSCLLRGRARIDFCGLPAQLKLELQYAVQCRADQATITLPPPVAAWTIRQAREANVASLLEHSAEQWADRAGPKTSSYPAFLAFARNVVEVLHEGTGWDAEYPRDTWRLDRLPGLTINAGKPSPRTRPVSYTHLRA